MQLWCARHRPPLQRREHGTGTGKLRRGLRDWLASVPYVERVADAEQSDGGPGCSVIWVK